MTAATHGFARDTALVARFELAEAVRSRLLVVMVLLFVGGGALGAWGYTAALREVEENAAKLVGAPSSARPGATVRRMRETTSYRDLLRLFMRDDAKADHFARMPPIVVFYAWAAFLFTPWLLLFTSAETIATEVANRSIRYSLLRTGRLPYALGKLAGQAMIVVGVTGLAAVVFFFVAWLRLSDFEAGATALGLLAFWPRVVLYNLPFLGWAMFASMATSSANLSRILSLGGAVVLAIVAGLSRWPWLRSSAAGQPLADLLSFLTPFGHWDGLFYPAGGALGSDVATCVALTVLYFAAGFAILRRRDV